MDVPADSGEAFVERFHSIRADGSPGSAWRSLPKAFASSFDSGIRDRVSIVSKIVASSILMALPSVVLLLLFDLLSRNTKNRAPLLYGMMVIYVLGQCMATPQLQKVKRPLSERREREMVCHFIAAAFAMIPSTLVAVSLVRAYTNMDPHWYFVNHSFLFWLCAILPASNVQLCLISASVQNFFHHDPPADQQKLYAARCVLKTFAEAIVKAAANWVFNLVTIGFLVVPSVLRFKVTHDWRDNCLARYAAVYGFMLFVTASETVLTKVMNLCQRGGFAFLRERVDLPFDTMLVARLRDLAGHGLNMVLILGSKMLVTTLQSWEEALVAGVVQALQEGCLTAYFAMSEASKLNGLVDGQAKSQETVEEEQATSSRSLLGAGEQSKVGVVLPESQAEMKDQRLEIKNVRMDIVMGGVKHLTTQILEYQVMFIVAMAAVVFTSNTEVTGFASGWSLQQATWFLATQFLPEILVDIVGLGVLKYYGLRVRELFESIPYSLDHMMLKVTVNSWILPIIVLLAQERRWGA